uniref:Uncharacterized protein n=1 Tax=Opuntia streptacantha TaxID=393608 RepID=A0A7C9A8M1_OPUST
MSLERQLMRREKSRPITTCPFTERHLPLLIKLLSSRFLLLELRLLIFWLHTKGEERLDCSVVLGWEKLCLSWNLLTTLPKLMVVSLFLLVLVSVHVRVMTCTEK